MLSKFLKVLPVVLLFFVCTGVFAQEITLKRDNYPLGQILNEISQQSGKTFAFSNELNINGITASLDVKNLSLEKTLDNLLKPLKIDYVIKNNQVLLRPLVESSVTQSRGKESPVYGIVTDKESGDPMPGVVVSIAGKENTYELTDHQGNYRINASANEVLLFNFMGYKVEEVRPGNSKVVNVVMTLDAIALDNVVVTGYQTLSRERATGSFSVITSKDLQNRITPNLIDRIEGLTTGLMIDQNNNIVIRGVGTLYGDSQPLIVLDGFPIEGDLSTISPEDVESITVLKDASAASIWGTKAANGVIVITSKEGLANQGVQIDASYYASVGMKQNVNDLFYMNSAEKIEFYKKNYIEMPNSSYSTSAIRYAYDCQGSASEYRQRFNPFTEALGRFKSTLLPESERYTEAQFNAELERLKGVDGYKQFTENLLRNSFTSSANVSLKYNNEINSLVATFGYDGEKGTSRGNTNDRFIVNIRDRIKFWKKFELDLTANIIYQDAQNNGLTASYFTAWQDAMEPFQAIVNPDGTRAYDYHANIFSKGYHESMGLNYTYNPIDQIEANDNTSTALSTRLQGALTYNILPGLSISTKYQYERDYSTSINYQSTENPNWRNILNDFFYDGEYITLPFGGSYTQSQSQVAAWTWRNQVNFNRSFSDNRHIITAIAGLEVRRNYYLGSGFTLLGYDKQTASGVLWNQFAIEGDSSARARDGAYYESGYYGPGIPYTSIQDTRERAYFANASYIFLDKYTLSGSFRLDQASLFGFTKEARNNYLWSAGASWNAKKENFLSNNSLVDRLLVRLTYGVNGNRPAPNYTAYMVGSVDQLDHRFGPAGTKRITIDNPGNPSLKSERVYTLNLGIDYAFFDSRLRGTLELYDKTSKDLIGPKALDITTGWSSSMINYASMNNRGIELLLTATPIRTKDWYWDVNLNFSYNRNKVTDLEVNHVTYSNTLYQANGSGQGLPVVGKPIGRLYAYKFARLNEQGDILVYDKDGNEQNWMGLMGGYDIDNYKYMGTEFAPFYGSFGTNLSYKEFTLGFNFTYKFGHVIRNPLGNGPAYALSSKQALSNRWNNQWMKPGDEATTNIPRQMVGAADSFNSMFMDAYYISSDINVQSAASLRLKDVHLDYRLPQSFTKKMGIRDAIVKFQIQNLFTWVANDWGYDPDYYSVVESGMCSAYSLLFPAPTTYTLGVNFAF